MSSVCLKKKTFVVGARVNRDAALRRDNDDDDDDVIDDRRLRATASSDLFRAAASDRPRDRSPLPGVSFGSFFTFKLVRYNAGACVFDFFPFARRARNTQERIRTPWQTHPGEYKRAVTEGGSEKMFA